MLSTLLKRSKQSYFSKLFECNWNNIKNTWKEIKSLISLKNISTSVPRTLNHNNKTVTNPFEIANIFNNHFASVAQKTRANVNYSHKYFSEYMANNSSKSFLLSPTNENEISGIISSLNPNKSVGLNSKPTKILKLLIFPTSIISLFLWVYSHQSCKLSKPFLYMKKDSKLDCNNYRPTSLLPNIEKKLDKLVYNRITKLLNDNNFIYPLQFGF